jgi:hypothetical protein
MLTNLLLEQLMTRNSKRQSLHALRAIGAETNFMSWRFTLLQSKTHSYESTTIYMAGIMTMMIDVPRENWESWAN